MTIRELRASGIQALSASSPSPELDADCLLQYVLACDKTHILFHGEEAVAPEQAEQFSSYIQARKTGLPVAYLTGSKEFFGYDFFVTPDVLIPKPDTEMLVEKALEAIKEKTLHKERILTICDMCTGSGCVGLSILKACTDMHLVRQEFLPALTMADISDKALSIARQNAERLLSSAQRTKVKFVRTNLFQMVNGTFDIIVTNPPYIPGIEARELLLDGRSEPLLALDGDIDFMGNATGEHDGLGIMRNLVPQAVEHLSPNGILIAEAGEYNAEMTEYIFRKSGLSDTHIYKDLSGQLRDILGVKR
ncbi:MAG: peptide chain release factor N(5)-glutamine methyltransferase [Treponema sp.]|nr:peptide chain release factor N(5)-glutamine methyltransferase [Treponema sp.]